MTGYASAATAGRVLVVRVAGIPGTILCVWSLVPLCAVGSVTAPALESVRTGGRSAEARPPRNEPREVTRPASRQAVLRSPALAVPLLWSLRPSEGTVPWPADQQGRIQRRGLCRELGQGRTVASWVLHLWGCRCLLEHLSHSGALSCQRGAPVSSGCLGQMCCPVGSVSHGPAWSALLGPSPWRPLGPGLKVARGAVSCGFCCWQLHAAVPVEVVVGGSAVGRPRGEMRE